MQFILAAILVVIGAGPLCDWVLLSPYAQHVWDFQQSVAIKSLIGHPDVLLVGAFLMACYGVAGEMLRLGYYLTPKARFLSSDVASFKDENIRRLNAVRKTETLAGK